MEKILFYLYFVRLRIRVYLGFHLTNHPINLKWRRRFWLKEREFQRKHGLLKY